MMIFQWLTVLSAALFAGGALYVSIVEHPARLGMAVEAALAQFRPSYRRGAVWQGALAVICLLSGALAALLASDWAWALGGLTVGAAAPFTLLFIMPINRKLLDEALPAEGEARRWLQQWGWLHLVRSVLGVVGLVLLLTRVFLR
ncbi:MAG: DUF1772 domain-containing protein [Acidobacteria bacterium]|nr:DUF1772 domain-containing protein [Acidobacteriota bacterium]